MRGWRRWAFKRRGRVSSRFEAYVQELASVIGHKDREGALRDYSRGLLTASGRKSGEPLAAVTAPAEVGAKHQSLLHFVGKAPWSDSEVLSKVRELVLPTIETHGPVEAWIIDDTGFPKKGKHSVGVARQYCGQLGKQDNCQNAVSLSIANNHASLPIGYRMYLPEEWVNDEVAAEEGGRSNRYNIPDQAGDRPGSTQASLQCRRSRVAWSWRMQATGATPNPRRDLGFSYAGGPNSRLWSPGSGPYRPRCRGRARDGRQHGCAAMRNISRSQSRHWPQSLPEDARQTITWREGAESG